MDFIEDILRGIYRLFVYVVFEIICYIIGWPILKVLTFGIYPKSNFDIASSDKWWSCAIGLFVLILFFLYIINFFGYYDLQTKLLS